MLEKIFKNKKGDSREADNDFWRKTLKKDRSYEYHHKKAVLEDGRLYDTESAKKVFADEASLEYIALGRAVQRVYFLTPSGKWFSAKEEIETESGFTDVGECRIQVTKTIYTYSVLRMEQEHKVKDLIGRNDYELYKEYFGEVEEA
nr:MAG TPA: hypothetical protein [Caudoviricetes sp.]